ncbi:hypothetical protein LJC34_05055 [Oscillospiraceae bacterium OttesenSCG-928-G22]|nr:hypothetical protein [Oscillospiraceae bacterium OttesenSCG-928-G22]
MTKSTCFRLLLLGVCCVFLFTGCEAEADIKDKVEVYPTPQADYSRSRFSEPPEPAMPTEPPKYTGRPLEDILKLANNRKGYDKLIQTTYTHEELMQLILLEAPIYDIEQLAPIECLRKLSDEAYYSVHQSDEGELLFLVYSLYNGVHYTRTRIWLMHKPLVREDFSSLVVGVSTLDDVRRIDPYGSERYMLGNPGPADGKPRSSHYTVDGQSACIKYEGDYSTVLSIDWVDVFDEERIAELRYVDEELYAYKYLLPIDREAVAKLAR